MIWQLACGDRFKRSDDGAWAFVARRTCVGKMRQCFFCSLQFSNARIERRYPLARQHTHLRPVSARIKVQQPLDLLKREARTLRLVQAEPQSLADLMKRTRARSASP